MNKRGVWYVSYFSCRFRLGYYYFFNKYLILIVLFIVSACSDNNKISHTDIDLTYQDPIRRHSNKLTDIKKEAVAERVSLDGNYDIQDIPLLSEKKIPLSSTNEITESPEKIFTQKQQQIIKSLIADYHYKRPLAESIKPSFLTNESTLNRYLQSLDAYSRYISKAQLKFIRYRQRNRRKGIGLSLLIDHNKILVVPVKNGSLYKAGLHEPRYLKTLNSRKVDYDNFSSYSALVDSALGHAIDLVIMPYNSLEKTDYRVIMQPIRRKSIIYQEFADTAVIRIDEFNDNVANTLQTFLEKSRHKSHLVIDLRYSPGGDLYATVDIASFFIQSGLLVTQLKKRGQYKPIELNSLNTFKDRHNKIYLLTSRFTASAAEIFVHTLSYYHKDIIVLGEKTNGKCLAQTIHELADHSALLLSSYELTLPTGKVCQGRGIQPDKIIGNIELLPTKDILLHIQ
ncbi:MAG: S41 family peptidase [bacterium]